MTPVSRASSAASILTQAASIPVIAHQGDTIRLCNLKDPRPRVLALGLPPAQERLAFVALGFPTRPKDKDLIDVHIKEVFARSASGRFDRFSSGTSALYSAFDLPTARSEMRYHARVDFFDGLAASRKYTFSNITVHFDGNVRDFRALCTAHRDLRSSTIKSISQQIGNVAKLTCNAIFVRSLRHAGDNQVGFSVSSFSGGAILGKTIIDVFLRKGGRYSRLS